MRGRSQVRALPHLSSGILPMFVLLACELGDPAAGGPCAGEGRLGCDEAHVLSCESSDGELSWSIVDTCPSGSSCQSDGATSTCVERSPLQAVCLRLLWCPTCVDGPWVNYRPSRPWDTSDFEVEVDATTYSLKSGECTPCLAIPRQILDLRGGPDMAYLLSTQLDLSASTVIEFYHPFLSNPAPIRSRTLNDDVGESCASLRARWLVGELDQVD